MKKLALSDVFLVLIGQIRCRIKSLRYGVNSGRRRRSIRRPTPKH